MSEEDALKRLAWNIQSAPADDKVFNALERKGHAIRTGFLTAAGKVEWRITADGAERLYPQLRAHEPRAVA